MHSHSEKKKIAKIVTPPVASALPIFCPNIFVVVAASVVKRRSPASSNDNACVEKRVT